MSRVMKGIARVLCARALGATLAAAALACGGGPRPESAPAPAEPAPAPAVPAAPAATAEAELEPNAEQLPLAEDFGDQADDEITADNYRSQLDVLEREILAEKK